MIGFVGDGEKRYKGGPEVRRKGEIGFVDGVVKRNKGGPEITRSGHSSSIPTCT